MHQLTLVQNGPLNPSSQQDFSCKELDDYFADRALYNHESNLPKARFKILYGDPLWDDVLFSPCGYPNPSHLTTKKLSEVKVTMEGDLDTIADTSSVESLPVLLRNIINLDAAEQLLIDLESSTAWNRTQIRNFDECFSTIREAMAFADQPVRFDGKILSIVQSVDQKENDGILWGRYQGIEFMISLKARTISLLNKEEFPELWLVGGCPDTPPERVAKGRRNLANFYSLEAAKSSTKLLKLNINNLDRYIADSIRQVANFKNICLHHASIVFEVLEEQTRWKTRRINDFLDILIAYKSALNFIDSFSYIHHGVDGGAHSRSRLLTLIKNRTRQEKVNEIVWGLLHQLQFIYNSVDGSVAFIGTSEIPPHFIDCPDEMMVGCYEYHSSSLSGKYHN